MKRNQSIIGGLIGAIALTVLHETIRQKDDEAPRMDKLGEEAINKGLLVATGNKLKGDRLYYTAMAGDVLMNALYYSFIGSGSKQNIWKRGILLGLAAGVGGVYLPGLIGLTAKYSSRTKKTSIMTVGYYLIGGLVTSAAINMLKKPVAE